MTLNLMVTHNQFQSTYHFPETSYTISGSLNDPNNPLRMIPHTTMKLLLQLRIKVAAPTIKTLTSTGSQGGGGK